MLHRRRMELFQRNARHRLGVVLDAQQLVDLGRITEVIDAVRISQCSPALPALLRCLVFARVVLCSPFGLCLDKLFSIALRERFPYVAVVPML